METLDKDFTIAAWFKYEASPESDRSIKALHIVQNGNLNYFQPLWSTGAQYISGYNVQYEFPDNFNIFNEWHHFAFTLSNTDFITYLDGVEANRLSFDAESGGSPISFQNEDKLYFVLGAQVYSHLDEPVSKFSQ